MNQKMHGAIESISLDGRTYHNITITPTLINFFYGKNGVGKSTIAQQIADGSGITPILSDYDVLVYDRDFIIRNIREDDGLPGVFSVSEGNIEKQKEIEAKESQLSILGAQYKDKKSESDDKSKRPAALRSTLDDTCWSATASFRNDMPLAMKNKRGKKSAFVDELLSIKAPKECDVSELTALYSTAFGSDTTIYQKMNLIQPIEEEKIPDLIFLRKPLSAVRILHLPILFVLLEQPTGLGKAMKNSAMPPGINVHIAVELSHQIMSSKLHHALMHSMKLTAIHCKLSKALMKLP